MPTRPAVLEEGRSLGDHGILFIGTKGAILVLGLILTHRLPKKRRYRLGPCAITLAKSNYAIHEWIGIVWYVIRD